ncbi:uncharacterized protein [Phyllobates terribilis]|uniref:uncharacterized protein n=1 Tax=Phyllobates terribilis TaxID=111132 RepID=UPI003CCB262D
MDYKAKEKSWLSQIDQTFGGSVVDGPVAVEQGWDEKSTFIQKLLIKRTKLWWNKAFLGKYITRQMIPRGLRIRITPTFPVEDATFMSKWEESCTNCSLLLMQLLVDLNSQSIMDLDNQIDVAQTELRSNCPTEKLSNYNIHIDKILDSTVKRIQEVQVSKFNRDMRDYHQKRVYIWRRPGGQGPNFSRKLSNSSATSLSDHSEASSSSIVTRSGTSNKRMREHNFHPYKRQEYTSPDHKRNDSKVINLSNYILTESDVALLSKGLSFAPSAQFDAFTAIKDLHIFARALIFKRHFFDGGLHDLFPTEEEQAAVRILEDLAIEHNTPLGGFLYASMIVFLSVDSRVIVTGG